MGFIAKLGILAWARELADDQAQAGEQQAWIEGFAAGMQEAGAITQDELDHLTGQIAKLYRS